MPGQRDVRADAGDEEERKRVEDPGAKLRDLQRVGEGGETCAGRDVSPDDRLAAGLFDLLLGGGGELGGGDLEGARISPSPSTLTAFSPRMRPALARNDSVDLRDRGVQGRQVAQVDDGDLGAEAALLKPRWGSLR
jgi:hypothetical protein